MIDGGDCGEPLLKLPELRVLRCAPRHSAAWFPEDATNIPHQTTVVAIPISLKLTNELVIGVAIDRVRFKEADLSGVRRDLGANPREILSRLRHIGQDINRIAEHCGAYLLKPAPNPYSKIRRSRRKLMNEQQPPRTAGLNHGPTIVSTLL